MIDQLRKYADLAGFDERLRWVVVAGLAVAVSILEAVGAILVYVLLGMVTGVDDALELPLIGDLEAVLPDLGEHSLLLWTAGAIAIFFIVRAVAVLGKQYVEGRVTENAGVRLSRRVAGTYLRMPYAFHLRRNSAELIRNAYTTVEQLVGQVFRPLVRIVSEGMIVVGILAVLVATAPVATGFVVLLLGPAAFVLLRLVYPRLKGLGRESQEASRSSLQSLQQSLGGVRDIKVLGRERFFEREFGDARRRLARARYLKQVLQELPAVGLETLMVLFIAGLFAASVMIEGTAIGAVPLLGLFGYAGLRLKPSMNIIVRSVNSLRFASAGIEDVYEDLRVLEDRAREQRGRTVERLRFSDEIHLDGVSFRYEGSMTDAIADVDLRIAKGQSVGIVGPTGGGKTTLVDLVLGLLEPTEGAVRVDGADIRGMEQRWQLNLGMVSQSLFLLDGTLRRNIALGLDDDEIEEDRIREAVRLAQLEHVVAELQDGLDTLVGERGVRLSGGQRQRVGIARALYRDPQVLVFDEGTSALDNITEAAFLADLRSLAASRTIITVAHRLTTVVDCDMVVLIDAGRVVDVGSYDELVRSNEHFQRMARDVTQTRG